MKHKVSSFDAGFNVKSIREKRENEIIETPTTCDESYTTSCVRKLRKTLVLSNRFMCCPLNVYQQYQELCLKGTTFETVRKHRFSGNPFL